MFEHSVLCVSVMISEIIAVKFSADKISYHHSLPPVTQRCFDIGKLHVQPRKPQSRLHRPIQQ